MNINKTIMTASEAKELTISSQLPTVLRIIEREAKQGKFTTIYPKDLTEKTLRVLREELGFVVEESAFSYNYIIKWK